MYVLLLALVVAQTAMAQPSAIVDDLETRAIAALSTIPHAGAPSEVDKQRESIHRKLEESLQVRGVEGVDPIKAFLYFPENISSPAPAIVILNPHEDPATDDAAIVPSSLARLGFIVLSLDVRAHHTKLDLLASGTTPEGLIQHDVRAALTYLKSRPNVDSKRIGLIGSAFASTIAAAMNPEFAAMVLTDALPDLREKLRQMRALPPTESPDPCDLVPGLLEYASTEELLALIAPKPILAINPARKSFDYASELYRAFGIYGAVSEHADAGLAQTTRYASYRWLAQRLQNRTDIGAFVESAVSGARSEVKLAPPSPDILAPRSALSESALDALFGPRLPNPRNSFGMNCEPRYERTQTTQPDIVVPMTILHHAFLGGENALRPYPCNFHTLFAVDDRGREALEKDAVVLEALRHRWSVFTIDPRGIGALKTSNESFLFGASLLLGENFAWRQATDVRRIMEFHQESITKTRRRSGLYVRGKNATLVAAYLATLFGVDYPDWIALRESITSIRDTSGVPAYITPFNALSLFDIPDLLRAAKTKVVVIDDVAEFLKDTERWQ